MSSFSSGVSCRIVRIFFLVILSCVGIAGAWAQLSTAATITGNVTDTSGALVPDATVTIKDLDTGTVTVTSSNSGGTYVVPGLNVGNYSVSISKEGFQTFTTSGIVLHPATTASVNGSLKVGSSSTTTTVNADAVQVETATIENSNSVESGLISSLPLNGRNYQALATLMPGVQNTSAGSALTTGGRSTNNVISVNGLSQSKTFYALDGVWNENTGNMNQTSVVPNPDSLEEVRVLQNNYSARYSLMGSSVILLQTKSGTRNLHGAAWEFIRNDDLNTKNYFNPNVLPYKQNIFGYNLGGPVFIPKVYNRDRNKTFFFFSEQFVVLHQSNTSLTGITPTQNQRAGIFNSPIKNPATGQLFPQNAAGQYVVSGLNANSVAYLNALYPLPNYTNVTNNYINTTPNFTNQRDDEIKVDQVFTPRFHLLAEYLDEYQKFAQNSLSGSQSGEIFPVNSETDFTHNKLAQVSLTSTLTPNLVNTTSIAMNIFDLDLNLVGITSTKQVPGFTTSLPYNGYLSDRLPLVTFTGGIAPQGIAAARPLTHAADLDDTAGTDFSYLKGRHYIQGGFSLVFNTKRQNVGTATNGQFTFSGAFTSPAGLATGAVTQDDALADFLLGRAATFTQVSGQPRVSVHGAEFSPYIEDRIKVTNNLQITAGVRIYHAPLPYGTPGTETNFVPSLYSLAGAPAVGTGGAITSSAAYNPYNGLLPNGTTSLGTGVPTNFWNKHVYYVGPLAGFAWDVFGNGKTSLRGGYGITYTRIFTNQDCSFSCASNPPAFQTQSLNNTLFPNPVGVGTAKGAAIGALSAADQNIQMTRVQSYSLILQHEVVRNWIASVAGAASLAQHVVNTININQPLPYQGFDFNPLINSGSYPSATPSTGYSPYYYQPASGTTAAVQFSPYPGYGAISQLETGQNQNWNALEVSLRHPGTALFSNVSYTYSKDLGDNPLDIYHPSKYYGPISGLDFRHSLSVTAVYTLPGSKWTGIKGLALGGWKLSGNGTARSGTSLTPGLSISNQGSGVRPDLTPGALLGGPKLKSQWFNTAAFKAPAPGFFGNAGTGIIRGPALLLLDSAMYKDFHITESVYFEFRAEAFNVLNHTNYTTVSTSYNGPTSTTFGTVTNAADPRILEFAGRFHF